MSDHPAAGTLTTPLATPGRAERLAGLFEAHSDLLYRLARRLTATADEARDLVQDTFLRAAAARKALPAGHEEAWLVRVLVNIRRDQWRRAAVRRRFHETETNPHTGSDGEAELIARTTIWSALNHLPPRRRAVLVLHELEGLPIPTIASLLGIAAVTTRWHLAKARKDLARVLKANPGEGQ